MSQVVMWPEKITWASDVKRLLVCGSRTMRRVHMPIIRVELVLFSKDCVVVHGAQGVYRLPRLDERRGFLYDINGTLMVVQSGADMLADEVAHGELGLETEPHPAKWRRPDGSLDRSAGFRRNIEMLESGIGAVLAFWDGISQGTKHTIDQAKKRKIPVKIVTF